MMKVMERHGEKVGCIGVEAITAWLGCCIHVSASLVLLS